MVWKMCEGSKRRNREKGGSSNGVWIATARCKKIPTMRATEKKRQTHESKARKLLGNGDTSALNMIWRRTMEVFHGPYTSGTSRAGHSSDTFQGGFGNHST